MFGLISTKDLYICEIRKITNIEIVDKTKRITYSDKKDFILAWKGLYEYTDVFTFSKYKRRGIDTIYLNDYVVYENYPVMVNKKSISKKQASDIINKQYQEIYQGKKMRLIKNN